MYSNKRYLSFTRFILFFIFLVIAAGSAVRMTQSGMGCPDWPTCFGMWIPPTNASQLPPDFEKYLSKQDIDHSFNAFHTWIEYINRLLGALLGFFILIHFAWSLKKYFKSKRIICWLSFFMLFATGFQGWLGKTVVDANLAVAKVTAHMLMALLIAIIPVMIIQKIEAKEKIEDNLLKRLVTAALIIVLIQIIIGTDVREQIDEVSRSLNYTQRNLWIASLDNFFNLHQFTAALAAVMCIAVFWRAMNHSSFRKYSIGIFFLILGAIGLGLIMTNFNIPPAAQPLHLLFSGSLFVLLFAFRLRVK